MHSILKSFVAISSAGFMVKIISVTIDPAIGAFSDSLFQMSPLAGLLAVVMVLLFTLEDIKDAYKPGFVGVAILSFQFMPLYWVIGIWIAGILVGTVVSPILERVFKFAESVQG
jgi:hypothetical protein